MQVSLRTILLAVVTVSATSWAADNPLAGTWKLNVAKSKFSPGPPPKSRTFKFEPSGNNQVKLISDIVTAEGEATHTEGSDLLDGKEHPVANSPAMDSATSSRVDAYTTERIEKKGGKVVSTIRRAVSKDGKTLTLTVKGTDGQGRAVSNVLLFDKQ